MKRLFTILMVVAAPAVMNAQSRIITQIPTNKVNIARNLKPISGADQKMISGMEVYPKTAPSSTIKKTNTKNKSLAINAVAIGQTYYDLQTNLSVCRRVALHKSGEVSATWTYSLQTNGEFHDRGTGYNTLPAGATTWGEIPDKRLENRRNGWPSITVDSKDKETVTVHNVPSGVSLVDTTFSLSVNSSSDRRNFVRSNPLGLSRQAIWNRTAASSSPDGTDYLYLINNLYKQGVGAIVEGSNGVTNPVAYSRSINGVFAQSDTMLFLPGYDSTRFDNGGGDSYALDARDSVVAIVYGGESVDLTLWKSTKYGAPGTFTKTVIDSFKYAPYKNQGTFGDTLEVNAGDISVVVDPNGNANVFYSTTFVLADSGDVNFGFIAGNSIIHWSEVTKMKTLCGEAPDLDGDGEVTAGSDFNSARYRTYSFANHPSAGVDAMGNLYLVYAAISEIDTTDINFGTAIGRNYADIYYTYSTDSGKTWAIPVNRTNPDGDKVQEEDQFPSMARDVNNYVHFIWQQDPEPGTNVGTTAGQHSPTENIIFYMQIPAVGVGYNVLKGLNGVEINAYPNPAFNQVTFTASIQKNMNMDFSMKNILGQEVVKISKGNIAEGSNSFNVNLEKIPSGVYFYTLSSNGKAITKKLVITK